MAKPVDTASKEREIEERLRKKEQMLQEKEQQARSRKEEVRREGGRKGEAKKKLRSEPCQVIFLFRKETRREKRRREMIRMIRMTG